MTSTYLNYKIYANDMSRTMERVAKKGAVANDTAYYEKTIGTVTNVSDFVNNYKLFSYAMKAYGLSDKTDAKAFMTKVLESDLSDQTSFANSLNDSRYTAFAKAFSFLSTGKLANTATVQSTDQQSDTLALFEKNSTSQSTLSDDETYYKANIGTVKTVSDLVGDSKLLNVVLSAYGISSSTSTATIESALESDVSDPKSSVNQSGNSALQKMAADFNFASDGTVTTQRLAQSQADMTTMAAAYTKLAGTDTAAKSAASTETTYVSGVIESATSVDDIVNDARVVSYIGKAFGVTGLTAATLKTVLTSDPNDETSAANVLGENYRKIAAAFNFTTSGTIARPAAQQAQSKSGVSQTVDNYLNQEIQTEAGDQSAGAKLALYFANKASGITSVYQILADKDLLTVVQTALGISSKSTAQDIDIQASQITSKLKLSDLQDPKKLDKFISKFAALYDINNSSSTEDSTVATLFGSSGDTSAISMLSVINKSTSS